MGLLLLTSVGGQGEPEEARRAQVAEYQMRRDVMVEAFGREFQIEAYLEGHAQKFVGQFDPVSYIYLSRAMDWFDLADYGGTVEAGVARNVAQGQCLAGGIDEPGDSARRSH
mgnify:CR=1 FL=1